MYKKLKLLEDDRQYLCRMCGRCCRLSTTSKTYSELLELVEAGEQSAIDFLDIFEPIKTIEEAKKIDKAIVENIIHQLENENLPTDNLTFYTCKYIGEDNKCSKYLERKELCKVFPKPWAVAPPNCGFEGWQFVKRETHKQKVRLLKEELLDMETQFKKAKSNTQRKKIERVIQKIKETLELYAQRGPIDW